MRNPASNITAYNTSFVPFDSSSSTTVISFLGGSDSNIMLENTGDLAVSSFTWTTMFYPETYEHGELFIWNLDSTFCVGHGPWIRFWLKKLWFYICPAPPVVPLSGMVWHPTVISLQEWHTVGVSYDANTGAVQMYVDGIIHHDSVARALANTTVDTVSIGARYYSNTHGTGLQVVEHCKEPKHGWGWILGMDTPLCGIN